MGSKEPSHASRIYLLSGAPQTDQAIQLSPKCRGPTLVPCRLPSSWPKVTEFLQAWFSCFFGFLFHELCRHPPPQLVEFIIPLFYWSLAYWLTVHLCICRKFLCGNNSPSIFWINTRRCQGMQESSVQILPILGSRNSIYVLQISVIFGVKQTNKQKLFNYDLLNYRERFTLKRYSYSWTPWWVDHYGRDI